MKTINEILIEVQNNQQQIEAPSDAEQLAELEKSLKIELPVEYKDFMLVTNGYTGQIGKEHLVIWKVEELAKLNEDYGVKEFAPHLLIFGTNGGGEAYAFDKNEKFKIVKVPFVGMGSEEQINLGKDFTEFLNHLLTKE